MIKGRIVNYDNPALKIIYCWKPTIWLRRYRARSDFRNYSLPSVRKPDILIIGTYTDSQVEQIYDALQTELDKSRKRFTAAKTGKKRFSLSDSYEPDTPQERYPTIVLALPDGTYLRAKAIDDPNFPAINIYWDKGKASEPELVAFVEHNPERGEGHEVCIGVYRSDEEDTIHYGPYVAERK